MSWRNVQIKNWTITGFTAYDSVRRYLVVGFNNLIICWGTSNHGGNKVLSLPISYKTVYKSVASIGAWTANAPYSICTKQNTLSQVQIDKWYNNGQSLGGLCAYHTIGY